MCSENTPKINGINTSITDDVLNISMPVRSEPFNMSLDALVGAASHLVSITKSDKKIKTIVFKFHVQEYERREDQKDPATVLARYPAKIATWSQLYHLLRTTPAASVAVVGKNLTGEAFEFAMLCDRIVVEENAECSLTHINYGAFPFIASYVLPYWIGLDKTIRMILCGKAVKGSEGASWGLFDSCAPANTLEREVEKWIKLGREGGAMRSRKPLSEVSIPNLIHTARDLKEENCCRDKVLLDFAVQAIYQGVRYLNDHRSGLRNIAELILDYIDTGHLAKVYLKDS